MRKAIVVVAIAALVLGCSNLFNHDSSSSSPSSGPAGAKDKDKTAAVHFVVSGPKAAASAKPAKGSKGLTIAFVTVTAQRSGSSDIVANLTYDASTNTASGDMTGLDLGQWTFLGQATDSGGNILYMGQTIYTVVSGTNSIAMSLYENIGAIKVVAGWELAGGFTDLKVTATRDTFPTVVNTEAVPATVTGSFAYLINLTAGDWSVVAEGYAGGVCYFRSAATTVTVADNTIAAQSLGMPQIKVTPVLASPDQGTYATAQSVTLSTATSGASIYYRTDGGDPGADLATAQSNATQYTGAIAVGQNETITARAYSTGTGSSIAATDETTLAYQIQAAAPSFSIPAGIYTANQSVTITTTLSGATIRYTTDDSVPTDYNGTNYSSPIAISGDATGQSAVTTHLKAIVIKYGCAESPVTSADYTITGTVATPTMSPDSGSYATAQTITLATTTPNASIRYTTGDGTQAAPTETTGTLYSAPFTISHNTTIKAIAYLANWADSSVVSKTYTLDLAYTTLSSASPIKGALEGYLKMTAANSPYHIGANVAVDTNTILYIEPGVTIKFDGNYYLRVDGTMIANGTSTNPITFTSNQATPAAGDWQYIQPTSATTEISYCSFQYASRGIYIPYIYPGPNFFPASISNCSFSHCLTGADLEPYSYAGSASTSLVSCSFVTCTNFGIILYSSCCNIDINSCTITGSNTGISLGAGRFGIEKTSLTNNSVGIFQGTSGADISLQDDTFSGNTLGYELGDNSPPTLTVKNCNFGDTSELKNDTTYNYDFSGNYWGTTTEATIQGMIYDYYDDISYGKVNYTPWLGQAVTW